MYAESVFQLPGLPLRHDPGPTELPNGKRRWRRNQAACDACHTRRVRCDMVFSTPCSRCQHKDIGCALTRERRKRGRRGRSEQANAKRAYEAEVYDISTPQEEGGQNEEKFSDASWSTLSLADPITPDSVARPDSLATDEVDDQLGLDTNDFCRRTSSFDLLEEEWLPMAHPSQDLLDLGAEDEVALPPLPDDWTADEDMTPHTANQVFPPITPGVINQPFPNNESTSQLVELSGAGYDNAFFGDTPSFSTYAGTSFHQFIFNSYPFDTSQYPFLSHEYLGADLNFEQGIPAY